MNTEHRLLAVPLTDEELKIRGDQLATKVKERAAIDIEKKVANDIFKTRIQEVEGAVNELSSVVKERREYRPVECRWVENRKLYTMELVRVDTNDRVDARAMTDEERQLPMVFDAKPGMRFNELEVDPDDKPAPKKRGKKTKAPQSEEHAG